MLKKFLLALVFFASFARADIAEWHVLNSLGKGEGEINLKEIEKGKWFGTGKNSWLCILTRERGNKFPIDGKMVEGFARCKISFHRSHPISSDGIHLIS